MIGKILSFCCCALLLAVAVACSRQGSEPQLSVEIPAGFSGNFVLNMGVRTAPPLSREEGVYFVTVPPSGSLATSTVLERPKVTFRNAGQGSIWGFSQSMFTTGDGISVGGKIEFFVGTQKDFEAEQNKKNHSGKFLAPEFLTSGA